MKPKLIPVVLAILSLAVNTFAQEPSPREQSGASANPLLDFFFQQGGALAIAIILAVGTAVITYRSERLKQKRESKIKSYEGLIRAVGTYIRTQDAEKKAAAFNEFSDASMSFCVWADKAVLVALADYMRDSTHKTDPSKRTDIILLRNDFAKLVAAIRADIGIEPSVINEVGLITFGDEWDKAPHT